MVLNSFFNVKGQHSLCAEMVVNIRYFAQNVKGQHSLCAEMVVYIRYFAPNAFGND